MSVITSDLVQKLRGKTGAGIMDCKRALEQSKGDLDKAIQLLREQGAASAAKRSGRTAGDGLVSSFIDPSGKSAVLLELNSETDFVARTDDFQALVQELAKQAAEAGWKSPEEAPTTRIQEVAGKLGENIVLRRFVRYERQGTGTFASYIHPSGGTGKVGVLLELGADNESVLSKEETKSLAKDLAMQVAATSPRWVKRDEVPAEIVEQEKSIAREQAKRENKPEKIWDKIAQGKLQQFYQQFCLLDQPFVKEPGGKVTVGEVISGVTKKVGGTLVPLRFARYRVGEEE